MIHLYNTNIVYIFAISKKESLLIGEMAEWSIAAVLKTVEGHTSGGSNPSLSAIKGVNQAFARFTPFITPKSQDWLCFFDFFKINAGEKKIECLSLFISIFLNAAQAKISLVCFGYIANGLNQN